MARKKNDNNTKETKISFGTNFWSAIGHLFKAVFGIFNFAQKRQEKKMQEFPLKEEEHKENKGVRLIEVEIEKIDKSKKLLKKYKSLEKRAKKLDKNLDELIKLPAINLQYLEHLDKELEKEEEQLEEELPDSIKEEVKKSFKERRKERKKKRKDAKKR